MESPRPVGRVSKADLGIVEWQLKGLSYLIFRLLTVSAGEPDDPQP
jgi:hypothetical protein